MAIATAGLERKKALLLLLGIFTLGNLACALAPNYPLLMAARVLTALSHGAFFGIGSVVASNLVPRNQRAQAIALMFFRSDAGQRAWTSPAGTALGQAFGWRASFWAIVPIGLIAAAAVLKLVHPQAAVTTRLIHEFRVLRNPRVLLVLAMSVLGSASLFCVFTYITPTLETVTGVTPRAVTMVLLLFGVGITAGNFMGGALSDRRPVRFLVMSIVAVTVSLACLYFAEPFCRALAVPMILTLLVWGALAFAAGTPLQARIVDQASAAPNLASTLNQGGI